MTAHKPTIFSGIKPSGDLHLGNYLGALTQWKDLQHEYDSIFCVVDLHAITVKQEPELLRKRIIEITKHFIASGVDPEKAVIFQQSAMPEHTELCWLLNTQSRMSDLLRMTQFKDKTGLQYNFDNDSQDVPRDVFSMINKAGVGLFDYPVLMAADILLYQTEVVPVGEDQVQHVELTRDLAKRFNHHYGQTFTIPKAVVRKEGARIMGLDDPAKKMGKSDASAGNSIAMLDDPAAAAKKIMRATTDTGTEIKYDKDSKPGISNLLTIYSILANKSIKDLEKEYQGKGYGDFKKDLAEVVKEFLTSYQQRYNAYSDKQIKEILKTGAEKVRPIAQKTLADVKHKLGLTI